MVPNVQIFRFHNRFENYTTANVQKYGKNELDGLKLPSIFYENKVRKIFQEKSVNMGIYKTIKVYIIMKLVSFRSFK